MKVGDKVRFLNSEGGGIVVRILKNGLVGVEDSDGFEIPTPEWECVVIESSAVKPSQQRGEERSTQSFFGQTGNNNRSTPEENKKMPETQKLRPIVMETKEGESITMLLAFVPQDIKLLNQTTIDAYLINDSNYYLSVLLMHTTSGKASTLYQGEIPPHSKEWIEELNMEELNDWAELHAQILTYKQDKVFNYRAPYAVKIKNDLVRFYKLHSYVESEYFADEKALMVSIITNNQPIGTLDIDPDKLTEAILIKEPNCKPTLFSNKQKRETNPNEIVEVDLHINELLDNANGLSNAEILSYQLEVFRNTMQEHIRTKGKKIVFIHGKGEGVLRKALIDELLAKYKSCLHQDASFKEYGFGATLVIIK